MSIPIDHNFQTPPNVCAYMADMVPPWVKVVFEPTPGYGQLADALKKKGFHVPHVDDYFLTDRRARHECIVMNPPFSSKSAYLNNAPETWNNSGMKIGYHILFECLNMSDNVIALVPWFTISDSDERLRALKQYGIKSITALPRKTFQYARIQTVVLEMQKGFCGQTAFKTLEEELSLQEKVEFTSSEEILNQ